MSGVASTRVRSQTTSNVESTNTPNATAKAEPQKEPIARNTDKETNENASGQGQQRAKDERQRLRGESAMRDTQMREHIANQKVELPIEDIIHSDPQKRQTAMKRINLAAADGNAKARAALRDIVSGKRYIELSNAGLSYDEKTAIENSATTGLAKAAGKTSEDYTALLKKADSYSKGGKDAEAAIENGIQNADPAAFKALRGQFSNDGVNGLDDAKAANYLTKADPKDLTPADYQNIAKEGLGQIRDNPVREFFQREAAANNPQAIGALRDVLSQKAGRYDSETELAQGEAAKVFAQNPDQMNAKDVDNLKRIAIEGGPKNNFYSHESLRALAAGASKNPPTPGSQKAYDEVAKAIPTKIQDPNRSFQRDNWDSCRRVLQETTDAVLQNTQDPQLRSSLAASTSQFVKSTAAGQNAFDALKKGALAGDPKALSALANQVADDPFSAGERVAHQPAIDLLKDVATQGHAGAVHDAMQNALKNNTGADCGRGLEVLGTAAAQLPANDPRVASTRERLRNEFHSKSRKANIKSAAAGMEALSGRLAQNDIDALLKRPESKEAGQALAAAGNQMSPGDRAKLIADVRGQFKINTWHHGTYAALGGMAKHLGTEDVALLKTKIQSNYGHSDEAGQTLARVINEHPNKALRDQAAMAVASTPRRAVADDVFDSAVRHASGTQNKELKNALLSRLPSSPVTEKHLKDVTTTYGRFIGNKIKNAPEGSNWNKLGQLLQAKNMAKDPKWASQIDVKSVDKRINDLMNGPLKADAAKIRDQVIRRAVPTSLGYQQSKYLQSDAYQQRLSLLGKNERAHSVKMELAKLEGVAPGLVQETADGIVGKAAQRNALSSIQQQQGQPGREASFQKALAGVAKGVDITGGTTSKILDVIDSLPKNLSDAQAANQLVEGLTAAEAVARQSGNAKEAAEASKALRVARGLKDSGKLGTVLAGASLLSAVARGGPEDTEGWAALSSDVLSAAGNASDIGKLFRVNSATKLGRTLKFMDVLGPAGDIVGAAVDGYGSWKDFNQGDYVGGSAKAVGAASGIAGAAAGVAILAGASGPAAPVVLLGAAVVGIGAWAVDSIFGKSDEQSFLENLGVWKD